MNRSYRPLVNRSGRPRPPKMRSPSAPQRPISTAQGLCRDERGLEHVGHGAQGPEHVPGAEEQADRAKAGASVAKRRATGPCASARPNAEDSAAIEPAVASANRASAAIAAARPGIAADEQDPHPGGAADAVHRARCRRPPAANGRGPRDAGARERFPRSRRGRARARGRADGSGAARRAHAGGRGNSPDASARAAAGRAPRSRGRSRPRRPFARPRAGRCGRATTGSPNRNSVVACPRPHAAPSDAARRVPDRRSDMTSVDTAVR